MNDAYIGGFIAKCLERGVDAAPLLKQAGLADWFTGRPAWYGSETAYYRPHDDSTEAPGGVQHSVGIRENDELGILQRALGRSKSTVPRSRVAEIIEALQGLNLDVKDVGPEDEALEFGYPVGAGYVGSSLTTGKTRKGDYLPADLRAQIDAILYNEGKDNAGT
jgi:hypothetical protein